MALAEAELELISAATAGPFESPPWQKFLDMLRQHTGAQYAVLNFRPPNRPFDESVTLLSGADQSEFMGAITGIEPPAEPPMVESLEEARLYTLPELLDIDRSRAMKFHAGRLQAAGATMLRQMRIQESSGINAWFTIIRREGADFDAGAEQLLLMISRFLRVALQNYVAIERERYDASLSQQAVRGLFGWLALDASGIILDHDQHGGALLASGEILKRTSSGKLAARDIFLEREIYAALEIAAADGHGSAQTITLNRDPWYDMMMVPARHKSISVTKPPAAIAYVHGDSWGNADRLQQLVQLFRLSPGEARLTLALCRGMTIAEAATEYGLAEGTARNYCKSAFAKTGARGQPDLVRIVMRSVLAIAPGEWSTPRR
jgi:DNA-binding CsgD family transcriptional regulator